jgi:hypothetical protein
LIGQPPGDFAGLVRDTAVIAIPSAIIMPLGVGADAAQTIEAWRGRSALRPENRVRAR